MTVFQLPWWRLLAGPMVSAKASGNLQGRRDPARGSEADQSFAVEGAKFRARYGRVHSACVGEGHCGQSPQIPRQQSGTMEYCLRTLRSRALGLHWQQDPMLQRLAGTSKFLVKLGKPASSGICDEQDKTPERMLLQWPAGTLFVSNFSRGILPSAVTAFGADVAFRPLTVRRILEVTFFSKRPFDSHHDWGHRAHLIRSLMRQGLSNSFVESVCIVIES